MSDAVSAVVVAAHPTVRRVVENACREAGVIVVDAIGTATEATAACRSHGPELLVLDLDLPDADGFRVLADLGDLRPPSILVLAERADGDQVLRALRLGARGYLTKAGGLRDLGTTIRRVIAGERVMTPKLEKDAIGALGRMARHAREGADLAASLSTRQQQVLEFLSRGEDGESDRFETRDLSSDRGDTRRDAVPKTGSEHAGTGGLPSCETRIGRPVALAINCSERQRSSR